MSATHEVWRDEETAISSTRRLIKMAREANKNIHVLHVTTDEEMHILAANRDIVSVEVTPQHLTLASPQCYDELGTFAQMNPPIRGARITAPPCGKRWSRALSMLSALTTRRIRARKKPTPIPIRPAACRACKRFCRSC